jgi:enediyne biosynthesis protein E4
LLFHNKRDGTFSEVAANCGAPLMVPCVSSGVAFSDIDNDGNIDVVIENLDGKPTILKDDGGNYNNWISVKLQGNGLNRDAIDARVKLVADDLVQWGEVHTGGSYLSASDLRLHFGLEKRTIIDLIEVHWLDGNVDVVRKVDSNYFVVIREGKGIVSSTPAHR